MNAPGAPIGFLGWFRQETDGTVTLISQNELRAWEKTQKGPAGEDLLRGVKLKARLDGVAAWRATAPPTA